MASKREAARLAAAEARARAAETHARAAEDRARAAMEKREKAAAEARAATAEKDPERSVVPWLRQLGYRVHEAREAAALCENLPDATLEEKIKVALGYFRPMSVAQGRAGTSAGSAAWVGRHRDPVRGNPLGPAAPFDAALRRNLWTT